MQYRYLFDALNRTYENSYFSHRGVSKEVFDLFYLGTNTYPLVVQNFNLQGTPAFPIFDLVGDLVSIAFRVGEDSLKYYSLPYQKSTVLYGLFQAVPSIISTKTVYITEGYFDVLAAFSFGITNTVGIMGHTLSREQVFLLGSFADTFILVPDSDKPGIRSLSKNRKLIKSLLPGINIIEKYVYPHKDFADYLSKK